MRRLDGRRRERGADWLQRALDAVRDDDAQTLAPPQLNERVLRAWDARWQHRKRGRSLTLWFAAAATVILALSWASTPTRPGVRAVDSEAKSATDMLLEADAFLAPDVLMDEASSVQYVRLSLAPRTMVAFGIPVADPLDDRPVAVEALVGIDGIPRAIRYAPAREESP